VKTNGAIKHAERDFRLEVARQRLADVTGHEDALEAIREIVTNLLGSEEIALFTVDRAERTLSLSWSFGIDAARNRLLVARTSPFLQRVIDGQSYFDGAWASHEGGDPIGALSAFVPILLDNRIVAVLGIRSLLPQKTGLDDSDVKLLRFLSAEAGKALFGPMPIAAPGHGEYV